MQYGVFTKKKILELSVGKITAPDESVMTPDGVIVFNPKGPYSEEIFGPSGMTEINMKKSDMNTEINPRMNLYGHIELNIPILIPNSPIVNLLGCENKYISGLANDEYVLAIGRPDRIERDPYGNIVPGAISQLAMSYNVKEKNKEIVKLAPTIRPERSITDPEWNEIAYSNGDGYLLIPQSYLYADQSKDTRNIRSGSGLTAKGEQIQRDFLLLSTTHALAFIFAHYDAEFVLKRIQEFNTLMNKDDTDSIDMWKSKYLTKSNSSRKNTSILQELNKAYKPARGLLIQGMEMHEYITDVYPVIPAGLRDPIVSSSKSQQKVVTYREINRVYNELIREVNSQPIRSKSTEILLDKTISTAKGPVDGYIEFVNGQYISQSNINRYRNIKNKIEDIISKPNSDDTTITKILGSKYGRFRDKDIGKRIDSSMRSVITPDKNLDYDQVSIPLKLLSTYFQEAKELDIKKKSIVDGNDHITFEEPDKRSYQANEELQKKLDQMRMMLIRFPSLHMFNEMGAKIIPSAEDTIRIPPLRCGPYNADFDGDTMAGFLLRNKASIKEVDEVMLPSRNLMDSNGNALMTPSQDMVLGLYFATMVNPNKEPKPVAEYNTIEALKTDFALGKVEIDDTVKVWLDPYDIRYNNYIKAEEEFQRWQKDVTLPRAELSEVPEVGEGVSYEEDSFEISLSNSLPKQQISIKTWSKINSNDNPTAEKALVQSTVGRFILNEFIPQDLGYVDRNVDKYSLEIDTEITSPLATEIITKSIRLYPEKAVALSQDLMRNGFKFATMSGLSLSILDIYPSPAREEILKQNETRIKLAEQSDNKDKKIQTWADITKQIENNVVSKLEWNNPLSIMVRSKSRGSKNQVMQLTGMKGLIAKADGSIVEHVVAESLIEGLTPISYFQASFGGRKGMVDRSLTTAKTGDIDRHLRYGLADAIVVRGDCGDHEGMQVLDKVFNSKPNITPKAISEYKDGFNNFIYVKKLGEYETLTVKYATPEGIDMSNRASKEIDGETLYTAQILPPQILIDYLRKYRVVDIDGMGEKLEESNGRTVEEIYKLVKSFIALDINGSIQIIIPTHIGGKVITKDNYLLGRELAREHVSKSGKIYSRNHMITKNDLDDIMTIKDIYVRSVMSCKDPNKGKICARCYGEFPIRQRYSQVGDAVGVIASQTLGERTTQLTMRTFHTGGVASGDDVTQGLPEFERFVKSSLKYEKYSVGNKILNKPEETTSLETLLERTHSRRELFKEFIITKAMELASEGLSEDEVLKEILIGDLVDRLGNPISWQHIGLVDEHNRKAAELEIGAFIEGIYVASGITLRHTHYELTVKSMTSFGKIVIQGGSKYAIGELVSNADLLSSNIRLILQNKEPAIAVTQILSVKELGVQEPATAMTFQFLSRNLALSSSEGREDRLTNPIGALASNKRIPTGSNGFETIREKVQGVPEILSFSETITGKKEPLEVISGVKGLLDFNGDSNRVIVDSINANNYAELEGDLSSIITDGMVNLEDTTSINIEQSIFIEEDADEEVSVTFESEDKLLF